MNERIKELAEQATITKTELRNGWERKTYTYQEEVFDKEKFAELIVRECIGEMETSKRCDPYTGDLFVNEYNRTIDEQISMLKEHFGVEE